MCKKRNSIETPYKNSLGYNAKVDSCMVEDLKAINKFGHKTKASCCGHGRYPKTIVVSNGEFIFELKSRKIIPRIRNFYRIDTKGYYYIPEVSNAKC